MYKNLENVLSSKNISKKSLAEFLGVNEKTIQHRFSGKTDWTWNIIYKIYFSIKEITKINKFLCPEYKLEYLFDIDSSDVA